jgi:hypothetical protein
MQRLTLRGLNGSDTLRLLTLTMGDAPAEDLAAEIHAETQGNPLFAKEIGRLLAAKGETASGRLPIPQGVLDAIGRRLQRQTDRCREVLALASVVGREFDPDVIGRVSGLQENELFTALDEAAEAGLVGAASEASGRLRFSHILVRDALYEDLPAPRRVRLHRTIGETLEAIYAGNLEPHLSELARHYREAGPSVADKAIDYAQRAGDRAASQYGYEEAARYYADALDKLETARSGEPDRTCELLLSLGEVLSRAGSDAKARQALRQAADLAEAAGRPDQLARAALEYGGRFGWERASIDPFYLPLLERALAAVGTDDSSTRVRLLARLAAAQRDDARRDPPACHRRRSGRDGGADRGPGHPRPGTGGAVGGPRRAGRARDGRGHPRTARMIELGEQIGDRERIFAGHEHRLHNFWTLGDRAAVEVELDALAALAAELCQPAQRWHIGTGRTMLALMEGRFEDAERLVEETLLLGQRAQSWNAVVSQRVALFVLRREQGRLAELADTIRRSAYEYPALVRFRCALAHLDAELGGEEEARAIIDDLLARDLEVEYRDPMGVQHGAAGQPVCLRCGRARGGEAVLAPAAHSRSLRDGAR